MCMDTRAILISGDDDSKYYIDSLKLSAIENGYNPDDTNTKYGIWISETTPPPNDYLIWYKKTHHADINKEIIKLQQDRLKYNLHWVIGRGYTSNIAIIPPINIAVSTHNIVRILHSEADVNKHIIEVYTHLNG